MIALEYIDKTYAEKNGETRVVFDGLDFCPGPQERSVAIMGRSGSGKTTLLRIIAGLDVDYGGRYLYDGETLPKNKAQMARFRREVVGVVPQSPMVLEDRNVLANVELAVPAGKDKSQVASECLAQVGLAGYGRVSGARLSGGEAQRVAIARAIAAGPRLLLADEPTAALDEKTEADILALFEQLVASGTRLIIATHNMAVANWCDAKYQIHDCRLARVSR